MINMLIDLKQLGPDDVEFDQYIILPNGKERVYSSEEPGYLLTVAGYREWEGKVRSDELMTNEELQDEKILADFRALALKQLNIEMRHAWDAICSLVITPFEKATEVAPYVEGDRVTFLNDLTDVELGIGVTNEIVIRAGTVGIVAVRQAHLFDNNLYGRVVVRTGEGENNRPFAVFTRYIKPVYAQYRR